MGQVFLLFEMPKNELGHHTYKRGVTILYKINDFKVDYQKW